jgi:uncharacterized protein YegP (UPF0339 family)
MEYKVIIPNFRELHQQTKNRKHLYSEPFGHNVTKYRLMYFPHGNFGTDYFAVYLESNGFTLIKFRFDLKAENGQLYNDHSYTYEYTANPARGNNYFVSFGKLFSEFIHEDKSLHVIVNITE